MSEELKDQLFVIEGEEVSLAVLAGIDLSEIDEVRGSQFPAGHYKWEIVADPVPELTTVDTTDKETNQPIKRAAIRITSKCIDILSIKDVQPDGTKTPKPEDIIGTKFTETFFLREKKDIGRVKAFLMDVGGSGAGPLGQLLLDAVGNRFSAPITHTKNKNNTDQVYVNMDRRKIVPLAAS